MRHEQPQRRSIMDLTRAFVWDVDGSFSGNVEVISDAERSKMADYVLKHWPEARRYGVNWEPVKKLVRLLDSKALTREAAKKAEAQRLPGVTL